MINIIISNFFYLGIFFIICRNTFKTKYNNFFLCLGVLVSCAIISVFDISGFSLVSSFVYLLMLLISSRIFFESSSKKTIIISVVYFIITVISELIASFVADLFFDLAIKNKFYAYKQLMILFISLIICFLLSKEMISIICDQFEDEYIPKYVYLIFVLPILTIVFFGNIKDYFYLYINYRVYILVLFGLLFSVFITFYIFLLSIKSIKWKQKLEISEREKKLLNERIDLISHNYDNSFNFLHDLLHRCNKINILISKNDTEELNKEFQDLYENCFQKYNMIISNSSVLSRLINLYSSDMRENNIIFRSTMKDIEYFNIDKKEMMSLFTLLLNMAIESCKQTKGERVILLCSRKNGGNNIMQINFSSMIDHLIDSYDTELIKFFEKYNIKYDLNYDKDENILSLMMLF